MYNILCNRCDFIDHILYTIYSILYTIQYKASESNSRQSKSRKPMSREPKSMAPSPRLYAIYYVLHTIYSILYIIQYTQYTK